MTASAIRTQAWSMTAAPASSIFPSRFLSMRDPPWRSQPFSRSIARRVRASGAE